MPTLPTPGGDNNTWGVELNEWLAKGGRVYDVMHGYGAAGDGTTDDVAAIQAAIDACGAAGGGIVWFPKATYKLTATTSNSLVWHLSVKNDNVMLQCAPGAELRTTSDAALIFWAGPAKTGGFTSWEANRLYANLTVRTITGPVAKGATQVTTATASHAGDFAAGDIIFIRTGQTTETTPAYQPDSEINEVAAGGGNPGTGVIPLRWPTAKAYAQENIDSGGGATYRTKVGGAGAAAPFGVSKVTDHTLRNVGIRGFKLTAEAASTNVIWHAYQILGFKIEDCDIVCNRENGNPYYIRDVSFRRNTVRISATGNRWVWPVGAAGFTDVWCEDNVCRAEGNGFFHLHEGGARIFVQRNTLTNKTSGTDPTVSVQARAYDQTIADNVLLSASDPSVFVDQYSTGGGVIARNQIDTLSSTRTAISVTAAGWKIPPDNRVVGRVTVTDLGSDAEEIVVPVGAMSPLGGATLGLVSPQNYQGITLADAATHQAVATLQVPAHWQAYDVYATWTNLGAGSGNVFLGLLASDIADTESINVADETSTGPGATAAPAQYVTKVTKMTSSAVLPSGRSSLQRFSIYRLGADAGDTLAASVALLGVRLRRAR